MQLKKIGIAGTMESNDVMITLTPSNEAGINIDLTSNVYQQFGKQIITVIKETLDFYGIENASVVAVDKGALDCTIRARTATAVARATEMQEYVWEV